MQLTCVQLNYNDLIINTPVHERLQRTNLNTIMKAKEQSEQAWDKVLEKCQAQTFNIAQSNIISIDKKGKEYCPRIWYIHAQWWPSTRSWLPGKEGMGVREATKRLRVALKEMNRSTSQMGDSLPRTAPAIIRHISVR